MPIRSALYVDGFNLYHAIDALQKPHLKWLNLLALGKRLIPRGANEELVLVRYYTALKTGYPDKVKRHTEYITALKYHSVKVIQGHFISDETECRACNHSWESDKEKETDVNLALGIVVDAYQDLFDCAYVMARQRQLSTATVWAATIRDRMLGGRHVSTREAEAMTLGDALREYQAKGLKGKASNVAKDRIRIEQILADSIANRPLVSLKTTDIARYRDKLKQNFWEKQVRSAIRSPRAAERKRLPKLKSKSGSKI